MAGYVCPCCGEISDTFGRGGGEAMAEKEGLGWLGRVPIDTVLVGLLDAVSKGDLPAPGPKAENEMGEGEVQKTFPLLERYLETTSSKVWREITAGIVQGVEKRRSSILERLEAK
jgi:hypothetical protein